MVAEKQCGFLVIGDITGYTSFVATTELEHSQEILTELLEMLVIQFSQVLSIVKLEGDAVFAYVSDKVITDNNTILSLIETTYTAFCQRIEKMKTFTTCTCDACQAIPLLDLKFFVHHGFFVVQNIAGIKELVGTDVNILHRLTKNNLDESSGWKGAYAMFTRGAIDKIVIDRKRLFAHTEEYEHVGEVETLSINLKEWYSQNRENLNKPVRIGKEEAVIHIPFTFDHPRPIVWQWMTDNQLRNRNDPGYQFTQIERPGGESNIGSKTHCAHGRGVSLEIILDWQPFNYFTLDTLQNPDKPSKLDATITYEFEEIDDKTQMNAYLVPHSKFPRIIVALLRWVMTRQMLKTYRNLNRLMGITKDLPLLDLTAIIED